MLIEALEAAAPVVVILLSLAGGAIWDLIPKKPPQKTEVFYIWKV
jgi:hypothetical protein